MPKLKLLLIGKTPKRYLVECETSYSERLKKYYKLEIVVIPGQGKGKSLSPENLCKLEGEKILQNLKDNDNLILLDEKGKDYSSPELAQWLEKKLASDNRDLCFVIGGAFGFSKEVYARASHKISLSRLTFNHEMVRSIFLEQLYRAFSIIRNEPYHHS